MRNLDFNSDIPKKSKTYKVMIGVSDEESDWMLCLIRLIRFIINIYIYLINLYYIKIRLSQCSDRFFINSIKINVIVNHLSDKKKCLGKFFK